MVCSGLQWFAHQSGSGSAVGGLISSSCGSEVSGRSVGLGGFGLSADDEAMVARMRSRDLRSRGRDVFLELLEARLLSSVLLLACCRDRRHRSVCRNAERNWREDRLYSSGFSTELR